MERPKIGIPYAEAGMLSSVIEELLDQVVNAWVGDGVNEPDIEDVDEFYQAWARTILSELKIADAYYLTCPECGKRIVGAGRTEDQVTKGAGDKYARHYAWMHTKEGLGSNLSNLEVQA